jgi:hypothetical protein
MSIRLDKEVETEEEEVSFIEKAPIHCLKMSFEEHPRLRGLARLP